MTPRKKLFMIKYMDCKRSVTLDKDWNYMYQKICDQLSSWSNMVYHAHSKVLGNNYFLYFHVVHFSRSALGHDKNLHQYVCIYWCLHHVFWDTRCHNCCGEARQQNQKCFRKYWHHKPDYLKDKKNSQLWDDVIGAELSERFVTNFQVDFVHWNCYDIRILFGYSNGKSTIFCSTHYYS